MDKSMTSRCLHIMNNKDNIASMTRKTGKNGRHTVVWLKNGSYFITGFKIHQINKMIGAYDGQNIGATTRSVSK